MGDAELRGFIAEADIEEKHNEIQYVEHIKSWVPIIFELRKSRVYDNILAKDWGVDAGNLIDLSEYEDRFPLIQDEGELDNPRTMRRRPSQSRLTGRRPSQVRGGR